jgi:LuxR family transcriptional regulator, maltose regulon positive regulatory protein
MTPSASQLITTKLKPPVSLASAISRPRLQSLINDKSLPKVVLVTAAAGFGKTTLLAQWHATVASQAGWLSLDRNDQDPIGFLRYLLAALNQAGPVISSATESFIEGRATMELDGVAARVGNDLAKLQKERVIFLDDYYLAETSVINNLLMTLIERSPAWFHLIIASRTLPDLPVASLKAHSALLEINAGDLKFNQPEADKFMNEARKLDLGPSEMRVLNARTEGWAAGLQLASLYLKDSSDRKRSIEGLSGGIRDITDYLATDVVRRLAPDLREFLLKSSVLERMNAAVCNTVLETTDAQAKLEQIEALGLFLFPLDATREWYRYHHLFRDFLLASLKRKEPQLVHDLYRKASAWCDREGLAEEAVNMALEANDFEQAALLVE